MSRDELYLAFPSMENVQLLVCTSMWAGLYRERTEYSMDVLIGIEHDELTERIPHCRLRSHVTMDSFLLEGFFLLRAMEPSTDLLSRQLETSSGWSLKYRSVGEQINSSSSRLLCTGHSTRGS